MWTEGAFSLTGGNLHLGGWFNSCTHLLKFLDLGLFKHREHVGIGAFCSLLGFLRCLEGRGGSIDEKSQKLGVRELGQVVPSLSEPQLLICEMGA